MNINGSKYINSSIGKKIQNSTEKISSGFICSPLYSVCLGGFTLYVPALPSADFALIYGLLR